jgi:2,4-dienoyl-CoA reductase-like NADH-dependent reductase (Old Yellow Enzyme family)
MQSLLSKNIQLPCGAILSNRLAKSAMSENMAETDHTPGERYYNLYRRWAQGGLGLCISGNVMIDQHHLGEPNNVVLENDQTLSAFKHWASASAGTGMALWPQLNHPGKQIPKFLSQHPVAPSAIAMDPKMRAMFATPRALREIEIWDIIHRFATAASLCKSAGFQGVQIHGAHGYLVSQSLSAKHNQRQDSWGGSLENRMRFLVEIYRAMRKAVGREFPIGVKINSADFQKGAFTHAEAVEVCKSISDLGMDLIEISGGSYEKPVMMLGERESTKKREAYFLQYASDIKKAIKCPLMVTGGFRTQAVMEAALASGEVDLIGLARPLAIEPDLPNRLLQGSDVSSSVHPISTGIEAVDKLFPLEITWYTQQLHRMGNRQDPALDLGAWSAILFTLKDLGRHGLRRVRAK